MNTIVIGGGQAGITLSYYLQQRGIEHLVLERDQAFSAWHNCWDSFRLNTANWMNTLPGMQKPFAPHKAWYDTATREEALDYFQAYRQMVNPSIKRRRHRHTSRRRRKHLAHPYRHPNLSNNQRRYLHRACCPTLCTRSREKTAAINPPATLIGLSKPRPDHNPKRPHRRQRQQWGSNLPGPGAIGSI